jgi:two-component system LytT family response regulator
MIRAVIIDDEPKVAKALEIVINRTNSDIEVTGIATNARDGVKLVKELKPDVLFLDVQMPVYSGFEVLEYIDADNVFVIFATAYQEFAIKAIRKKAFDYLLKPFDSEEVRLCLQRVRNTMSKGKNEKEIVPAKISHQKIITDRISIPVKDGMLFIKTSDIVRIEGSGSYSYIFTDHKEKHLVSKSLKEMEDQLDMTLFHRCHNSHIVNLSKIKKYIRNDGHFVQMQDGSMAEISRTRKDEFLSLIC